MSAYQRGIKPEQGPPQVENSTACVATGCPLPGVFRIKMHGPSPSICRAHDGTPAHEWPVITERVKRIERALFAALDLTNAEAGDKPDEALVAKFVKLSPDLATSGNPTARTYGAFVYGRLIEKVRPKTPTAPHLNIPHEEGLRHVDIVL